MKMRAFALVSPMIVLGACTATVQVLDDGADASSDAGESDAGGSTGPEAAAPDLEPTGAVAVFVSRGWIDVNGSPERSVNRLLFARIHPRGSTPKPEGCRSERVAGCEVGNCGSEFEAGHSAGPISFQVGASDPVTISSGAASYQRYISGGEIPEGTRIRFTAPGELVPGFDETVTMPLFPQVTLAADTNAGLDVDSGMRTASRNQDLSVELSESYTGESGLTLMSVQAEEFVVVRCVFAVDGVKRLSIPAAALSRVPSGKYQLQTMFWNQPVRDLGDYAVGFGAFGSDLTEQRFLLE